MKNIITVGFLLMAIMFSNCGKDINPIYLEEIFIPCDSEVSIDEIDFTKYEVFPEDCISTIIDDNFSVKDGSWQTGTADNNDAIYNIVNGVYSLKVQNENTYWHIFNTSSAYDANANYQMEVDMKYISGISENSPAALVWGAKDGVDNFYRFSIRRTGIVNIQRRANLGDTEDIIDPLDFSSIQNTGTNKLTIRVINGMHYFFVNEEYVTSLELSPFGNEVGFAVSGFTHVDFDNFKLLGIRDF